jgi:hypothetical protein
LSFGGADETRLHAADHPEALPMVGAQVAADHRRRRGHVEARTGTLPEMREGKSQMNQRTNDMRRITLTILVAVAGALMLAPPSGATSIQQARWEIRKHERLTPGDFEISKCGRAYRLVVCPVQRYNFEIIGLGVGPQDWEVYDCVTNHDRRVVNPLFSEDRRNDDCLWAIDRLFPDPDFPAESEPGWVD